MLVAPPVDHPDPHQPKSRRFLAIGATAALLLAAFIAWQVSSGQTARATAAVAQPRPVFDARLQLSPEHLEALHPVVSTAADNMNRIRRDLRSQLATTVRDLNATIAKDLSAERLAVPPHPSATPERKPAP